MTVLDVWSPESPLHPWLFDQWDDLYLSGTVDQATAGAVPYRFIPRLLGALRE